MSSASVAHDRAATPPTAATLLEAVRDAAGRVAAYLHAVSGASAERELKRDAHDIVTAHDRRSEEIAIEVLRRHVPSARILGEEGGLDVVDDGPLPPLYPTPPGTVTFVVDPIDGTSNFAGGLPIYCTSIAAQVGDTTVAGVVRMPELGLEVYADDAACHVQTHPLDGSATTAPPAPAPGPVERREIECVLSTGFPGVRDLEHDGESTRSALARLLRMVGALRSIGAGAAELALVAAGRLDATFGLRTTPWDVSAGAHLVRVAGGVVDHLLIDGDPEAPEIHRPGYLAIGPGRSLPGVAALLDEIVAERTDGGGDGDGDGELSVVDADGRTDEAGIARWDGTGEIATASGRFTVGRMREGDVPAVAALLADDVLGATRETAATETYLAAFRQIDADPRHLPVLVRDDDGDLVGTLQLTLVPGLSRGGATRLQIEGVRLAASVRGSGLGSALFEWAHAWGAEHGATLVQLTSDATREDAIRFYERLGYSPSHVGLKRSLP